MLCFRDTQKSGRPPMKRRLVLRGATTLLLVASCAPVHEVVADTSGRTRRNIGQRICRTRSRQHRGCMDALFKAMGHAPYPRPTVVLFRWQVQTACGRVNAAVGPLYCPAVQKCISRPGISQRVVPTRWRNRQLSAGLPNRPRDQPSRTKHARHNAAVRTPVRDDEATQPVTCALRTAGRLLYRSLGVFCAEAQPA